MSEELTLLDIESGLIDLHDELDHCHTEEERENVRQAIEAYIRAEVQKVDRIRAYIIHEEAKAEICRRESDRQLARARAAESHVEHVKAFCMRVLQEMQKPKVEGRTGCIRIQKNGGKLALEIFDESALPFEFTPMTITYPPDTEAIRKALEAGTHVPGAKLGERGSHVRIE
jgi:Siphovirus Gp157